MNSLTDKDNKFYSVSNILSNERIISDDSDIAESFNDFFVNIGPNFKNVEKHRSW